MKQFIKNIIAVGAILLYSSFVCLALSSYEPDDVSESGGKNLLSITDLVLIYGGGAHRTVDWNAEHFTPYVSYTDRKGKEHWLFDGFLMLEIIDGKGKIFATGYNGTPATKSEWQSLVDYYFTSGICIDALNKCVDEKNRVIGNPPRKRKIIIGIPEPIVTGPNTRYEQISANYWGDVNGKKLDFNDQDDRITACKWYIDYVIALFDENKFSSLELAGFYWIAETAGHTKSILPIVGEYIQKAGYTFIWIPYWKGSPPEPDYFTWKELGFHTSYQQPNYFFDEKIPYSRLEEACNVAHAYDLDLELEFDQRIFADKGDRSSRLYDYMNVFRNSGVLSKKRIAYYQSVDVVYQLYRATGEKEKEMYHDFCTFVRDHQSAYQEQTRMQPQKPQKKN